MLDLRPQGLQPAGAVYAQLPPARAVEFALQNREAQLADNGALVAFTGALTGRSPKDKYVVRQTPSQDQVWFGPVNAPMEPAVFAEILDIVRDYLQARPQLFVHDGYVCADPAQRVPLRVISDKAWATLFAQLLFRRYAPGESAPAQVTVYHAPELKLDAQKFGLRTDVAVILDVDAGAIVIAGTQYAGEIKKAIFSYLNYRMPQQDVFPMHCSANVGPAGDTALLFGLSGTGKTTLSADPMRKLIGDDEHGWSDRGIFNFEGGCYAKCIRLSPEGEPQIWQAIRFGSILENVDMDPVTRRIDFASDRLTENTRAAYPLEFIPGIEPTSCGGHPQTILFLTCDAFGVLPPISKLTPDQALVHFLLGYTAKVAGTEAGVTEPSATFSTCYASPFLTLPPKRYAQMLRERLEKHRVPVWLVNTGWTGGGPGVGKRMPLALTRRMVQAAMAGELESVGFTLDPIFGVLVPQSCPDVPTQLLTPRLAWKDAEAYQLKAKQLAEMFRAKEQAL